MILRGDPSAQTGSGERMRLTIAALLELGEVEIVAIASALRSPTVEGIPIRHVPIVQRNTRLRNLVGAAVTFRPRRLVAGRPRQQARLVRGAIHQPYDLVWVYTDRAALAVPRCLVDTPLVADLIDYEGERDVSLARNASWRLRRIRLFAALCERSALRHTLRSIHRRCSLTIVSSPADVTGLGLSSVSVLPNGYRAVAGPLGRGTPAVSPMSVMFVGFLMYAPNVEALTYLLTEVWPAVHTRLPEARLRVVGRGMDRRPWPAAPNTDMIGEVPSMESELCRADALVVPLKSGSGTRIKILEAWANRIPVVTTAKGCEGLGAVDGVNVLVAENAEEFANALGRLAEEQALSDRLIAHGYELYEHEYSSSAVIARVCQIAEQATAMRATRYRRLLHRHPR